MKLIKKYWLFLLILSLGTIVRSVSLLHTPISLSSDEVDMGYHAYSLVETGCDYSGYCIPLQFHSFSDVQPPIPIYLIALFYKLGFSLEESVRIPVAIFSFVGLVLTYLVVNKLSSKLFFDIRLKYLPEFSVLFLSLMPWYFTYSRIGFSVVELYAVFLAAVYSYLVFLEENRKTWLYLSLVLFSLTPMIYNTAKMAVIFYPFILLLIPGTINILNQDKSIKYLLLAIFVPLLILMANGQTSARFDYISIFTNPTIPKQIDLQRKIDLGPNPSVGGHSGYVSMAIHNKLNSYLSDFVNNLLGLVSTNFLFVAGDPNLRHSPEGWGMLLKTSSIFLVIGLYFLSRFNKKRLLLFISALIFMSLSTSAITREGGSHASRSFMFLIPIVIVSSCGFAYVFSTKPVMFWSLIGLILVEFVYFQHDYWAHYRYSSERVWGAGFKEVVEETTGEPGKLVFISPKFDNPLIFYLFYSRFDPNRFQGFVKNNQVYNSSNLANFDGNRIGDSQLYIGTPSNYSTSPDAINDNPYIFLTWAEVDENPSFSGTKVKEFSLPSGAKFFYQVKY